MDINKTDKEKLKWFFKRYIYTGKKYLVLIIVLIFIGSLVANISPYLYGKMLDSITLGDMDLLFKIIILYFFITLFTNLLSILEGYIGQVVNFKLSKNAQIELFDKMIRMRTLAYNKYETGEFISRLNGDTDSIVSFGINLITSILHIIVNIAVSLYFVITISIRLSSVAIFYIPATFLVTYIARKYFKELAERGKKFSDEYFSFQNEIFSNNTGIKSFRLEDKINNKYKSYINKEFKLLRRSIHLGNIIQLAHSLITVISSLYVIYLSALLIKDGILTIGLMVSFNTYINKLFSAISQVFNINISLQEVAVSLNRIIEVMSEDSEVGNKAIYEKEEKPVLECVDIAFTYDHEKENVLNNMDISIDRFGLYSIVGSNGCGKSTFAKLLIRLYDVEKGSICINEKNYSELPYDSIRSYITYVQKEEFFFNDTIINNIRLADESLKEEDIKDMCKKVGLDEFIKALPEGYRTIIGEGGSTLSSGQKQKLSIVRALLRDTPIYIFDEITANLDGKAEKDIIRIMKEYSKKSIILLISHKISSIMESDKIFVFGDGKIIDSGEHDYLSENNHIYQELFENRNVNMPLKGAEEIGG
ncbi:ABC transporter ATP-binding protein/permease [Tissierella carlieri]|jgi:ATP-binding cassette subfamily B protein|uniref:ABC transporter ATP-binding protein n=1 Tax=Tissierella carlieri TaxID=689904 RepID=UPI001C100250|nr:ABC transporter ATP-binding protein [Tissierella carlieri]MBU5310497.1 ABC transporter ATP-binding protein/permease [Tissierella carlieri]MDU5080058.1 ABC transporter ATP-binding protein [Bacillota bacterium]